MEGSLASQPILTIAILGALSLLPVAFMVTTCFVKLSVVFAILRNGLGTGQVPSSLVVTSLAALLTIYVMAPVGEAMVDAAAPSAATVQLDQPLDRAGVDAIIEAVSAGVEPLRGFWRQHAGAREVELFFELAGRNRDRADAPTRDDLIVLLPAFLVTELSEAFQIGFLIFVPFLVVDMVVANLLLALGMHMLSPTTVSLPFKLLLFVMVDGWMLLSEGLILGYS